MKRALRNVLLVGLVVVVPGAALAWLYRLAQYNPAKEAFKEYVKFSFDKMKTDESQWLQ